MSRGARGTTLNGCLPCLEVPRGIFTEWVFEVSRGARRYLHCGLSEVSRGVQRYLH